MQSNLCKYFLRTVDNLAYRKPVAQGLFEIIELFQPQFFTTRQSQHFTTQSIIRHIFCRSLRIREEPKQAPRHDGVAQL